MAAQEPEVTTYPQKTTFGEMRASGVRDVLIYCRGYSCGYYVETGSGSSGQSIGTAQRPVRRKPWPRHIRVIGDPIQPCE
jgi:hypothetical protein